MKRTIAFVAGALAFLAAVVGIWQFASGSFTLRDTIASFNHKARPHPLSVDLSDPAWVASLGAREFQVDAGRAVNGFSYGSTGAVRFGEHDFQPPIQFTARDNPTILVSWPDALPSLVAVVGLDRDGQRTFFVAHLDSMTSSFCKCPSDRRYWSPDKRHLVSLDVYEGQWFTVYDVETGAFSTSDFLGHQHSLWYLEGSPKWSPDGRLFFTKAVEVLSPFNSDSPSDAQNRGPLDAFLLTLDTQTLAISPRPSSDR